MNDEHKDVFAPGAFFVGRHSSLATRHCLGLVALAVLLTASSPARADILKLKDGQKISGTIVGFENGMFRVETEYGFVLVRKEKVSSIEITSSGAQPNPDKKAGEAKDAKPKSQEPGGTHAEANKPARDAARNDRQDSIPARANPDASSSAATAVAPPPAPPPPKPVSRPLNEPLPAHIDEHVDGNNYVNDTFHFVMYKPPDWKIYEELHREKVSAIVALASDDEQTVLFIDRQVWSGAPDLKNDSVEAKLRQSYENYKVVSESETQVDGRPAVRRRFDAVMEGAEWHGVAVRVAEGSTVYGIIGLTSAETFQFQESIFNKIVRSFHFLTPTPESASPQRSGGL
jgi:hypothetical protein